MLWWLWSTVHWRCHDSSKKPYTVHAVVVERSHVPDMLWWLWGTVFWICCDGCEELSGYTVMVERYNVSDMLRWLWGSLGGSANGFCMLTQSEGHARPFYHSGVRPPPSRPRFPSLYDRIGVVALSSVSYINLPSRFHNTRVLSVSSKSQFTINPFSFFFTRECAYHHPEKGSYSSHLMCHTGLRHHNPKHGFTSSHLAVMTHMSAHAIIQTRAQY